MPNLSYIRDAVPVAVLKSELTPERFVRKTNKLNNEIYIVNIHNAPNVLQEIGRLRELTFASADGGTGNPVDLDELDLNDNPYQQLIVWNPVEEEIVGGYRFIDCSTIIPSKNWEHGLSMGHYFSFKPSFIENYLPYSIELGRSWVQPKYQPKEDPRKGLFAMDNIWDGLGAIVRSYPNLKYFYGKVTMYTTYDVEARNILLNFMHHYFPDQVGLMKPIHPIDIPATPEVLDQFPLDRDHFEESYKAGFKALNNLLGERGETIPPLIKLYMSLSPSMKTFGTCVNPDFGAVEETGILIEIDDIYLQKKERHLQF